MENHLFKICVGGDMACFTRPEMKVERVSYEVMTPSAARGILEAILWKPAIQWICRRIHVLRPIRWIGFKRNEVTQKLSVASATKAMSGRSALPPLVVDDGRNRAQRHTLALRDVEYVIEAQFRMTPKAGPEDNPMKFAEMFQRRLEKGQCYRMPYLGCREFVAWFKPQEKPFTAINETRDLGWMLYDIEFSVNDINKPHFFHARLDRGIMEAIPPESWIKPQERAQ